MKEYRSVGQDKIIGYDLEKTPGGMIYYFELRILGFCPGAILAVRTYDGIIKTYTHISSNKPDTNKMGLPPIQAGSY